MTEEAPIIDAKNVEKFLSEQPIKCPYCHSPLKVSNTFKNAITYTECTGCDSFWVTVPNRFTKEFKAMIIQHSTIRERLFGVKV